MRYIHIKKIQILNFKDMHIKQKISLDGNILNGIICCSYGNIFRSKS